MMGDPAVYFSFFTDVFKVPDGKAVLMDKKKVKDYMTYDVVSVDFHGTVHDVIEKIQKTHHDGFPVVDGNTVIGYIQRGISCSCNRRRLSGR